MKATELLASQLGTSKAMLAGMLEDLADAPLTAPTASGGNHPLWVAGHVVYSEANLTGPLMFGTPNPLAEWKDLYGRGSEPSYEASDYAQTIPELLAKWDEVRAESLTKLNGLSDEDLSRDVAQCPPGREGFFGTFGKAFSAVVMHPFMHRGQLADARRSLGRSPLQA